MRLLVILLVFPIYIYCADIFELYYEYLPEKLKKQEELHQDIVNTLMRKAEIHPDMIYYQLLLFNYQSIADTPIDSMRLIDEISKIYLMKRHHWEIKQKHINDLYEWEDTKRNYANSFLKRFEYPKIVEDRITELESKFDLNKRNFFSFVYLTEQRNIIYQPEVDYCVEIMRYIPDMLNQIKTRIVRGKNSIKKVSNREIRDILIKFYYASYFELELQNASTDLSEIFDSFYDINFRNKNIKNAYIGFDLSINNTVSISKSFNYDNIERKISIYTQFPEYYLRCGYRIHLKSYLTSFSFIDIGLNYSSMINQNKHYYNEKIKNTSFTDKGKTFTGHVYLGVSDLTVNKYSTIGVSLVTPFIIMKNRFFVDIGFYAYISQYQYDIRYEFLSTKIESYMAGTMWESYPVKLGELKKYISGSESIHNSKFKVAPCARIKYHLCKYLSMDYYFQYMLYSGGMTFYLF